MIFLFEGLMTALTSHTQIAKDGITHLGYPGYFGTVLMVFKVLGSLALIVPTVPKRIKEWEYAGFAIDFIAAFVSICVVDGVNATAIFSRLLSLEFSRLRISRTTSFNTVRNEPVTKS